jgi:transcriptional regulator with XRE-family HTH domain
MGKDGKRGGEFGPALRVLRKAAGLSLETMARQIGFVSETGLSNIENGTRGASAELAVACDRILGTSPTLLMILGEEGNPMRRRAVLTALSSALMAGIVLKPLEAPDWLDEVVRYALGTGDDYEQDALRLEARYFTAPTAGFGTELLAAIMVLQQRIQEKPEDAGALRASARLSMLYGLWQGNMGDIGKAQGWHARAATLADRSGDNATRADVRGRAVCRGAYEKWSVKRQHREIAAVLELAPAASVGRLDGNAARIHLAALTGDLAEGEAAAADMLTVAELLPDPEHPAGPLARYHLFNTFLYCRIGTPRQAERAYAAAAPVLAAAPLWAADAAVYRGLSLVAAGDVDGGVGVALAELRRYPADVSVRVLGIGVKDLLRVVPDGYASSELDELRSYASTERGPWEAMR